MSKQKTKSLEYIKIKNKKNWISYQKKKKKILKLVRVSENEKNNRLENLLQLTKQKISNNWRARREKIYSLTHKSLIPYTTKQRKKEKHTSSNSEYFKVNRNINEMQELAMFQFINDNIKFRGLLVIIKIKLKETEEISHISNFYTKKFFERPDFDVENLFDDLLEKYSSKPEVKYEGFKIIDKYLRFIIDK